MLPEIVADENVDNAIVVNLREYGCNMYSIAQECPGITDLQVLSLARDRNALLITEDSDFGDWVFAHKMQGVGVLFLRYEIGELPGIKQAIRLVLSNYGERLHGMFVVITPRKIRTRLIDQAA